MKRWIFIVVLFLPLISHSQYFSNGQDRGSIHWKRISSVHFEVIFPDGFETQANHVANLMETSYRYTTETLKHKPKKVSIVLHTETVKSNAFLGWAPSRIEMYVTPHQQIYSQDWLEQLAIHEYRHMVQLSKLEDEMPVLLKFLFGEQAAAVLTAVYLPFWFIEGDAVSAETGLSNAGRGRSSDFHRELRAQVIEKGIYSYDKAYLGSFKDYVANYYNLGYFLVGGARMIYDKVIWDNVLSNVAEHPFSLNALDKGLKKSIGLNKIQLYDTVFNHLRSKWEVEDQLLERTNYQQITNNGKEYTDYKFGVQISDSIYLAEKRSLSDITSFVKIHKGRKEEKLFVPGYHFEESVSISDSFIIWSERLSHIRWYHSDGSLIRLLNWKTNTLKEYKFDNKLFSPILSPNKASILVVEADNNYKFYLSTINVKTGELQRIYHNENDFFITPSWNKDGTEIIVVILRNNKKAIVKIDLKTKKQFTLLPFDVQEVSKPIEDKKGNIFFIGGFTGIDNLYVLKGDPPKIFMVVSSRFGIADYSLKGNEITYSNFTSSGYQLVRANIDSLKIGEFDLKLNSKEWNIADKISNQEPGIIDFAADDSVSYIPKKYHKSAHLFNFHSWAPLAIDPYNYNAYPGVSVMSQNLLSTAEFVGGYRYRWQDKQGEFYSNFKYFGLFPVVELEAVQGNRDSYYYEVQKYQNSNNQIVIADTIQKEFSWKESNLIVKTYVPFDFSKGKYFKKLQPRIIYKLSNYQGDSPVPNGFPMGSFQTLETGVYAYQILKTSVKDVLPNFGGVVDFSYSTSLKGVANFGNMVAISSILYLPGLMKNHGIYAYNGLQLKKQDEYSFNDKIKIPRGHQPILNDKMYSFGVNYIMPICYPDKNIGRFVYFKRIKLNAFYDYAYFTGSESITKISPYSGSMKSTGFELTTNCHLLQFIAPFEIGLRYSYLFNKQSSFDFLFNIEFTL